MKTILFCIPSLGKGGAERVLANLSGELAKSVKLHILVYRRDVTYPHGGELCCIDHEYRTGWRRLDGLASRVWGIRRAADRIGAHGVVSMLTDMSCILTGKKVISTVRCHPMRAFGDPGSLRVWMLRRRNVKAVVANSFDISQVMRETYGIKEVRLIHNALDTQRIDAQLQAPRPAEFDRGPCIVSVGRLVKEKGVDVLLDAFARTEMKQSHTLLLLGEGELRGELEARAGKLGLTDRVRFLGVTDNPFVYMRHAEFLVQASRTEGCPNALLEALYCGTPAIHTDCDYGPREFIRHGENGLLAPVESPAELAQAMDRLHGDAALRDQFRQTAPAAVRHLQLERIARQWVELFDEVF